ncbi:MAG: hypothetical protein IT373_32475 [Polyangiaceae bacterium]|nr:hypothetical protein [Polyangiaceae bacterium]
MARTPATAWARLAGRASLALLPLVAACGLGRQAPLETAVEGASAPPAGTSSARAAEAKSAGRERPPAVPVTPAAATHGAAPSSGAASPSAGTGATTARELALDLEAGELALPPGESHVTVALPPHRLVTIGVVGLRHGLSRLTFDAPHAALGTVAPGDGALPVFVSLATGDAPEPVRFSVTLVAPAHAVGRAVDPDATAAPSRRDLKRGLASPRPLVGLPFPQSAADGYVLGSAHRYAFARVDVAVALRQALAQTRTRFRRNALALHDLSQWDGDRPASDAAMPRHIGHTGGREVDVGLPSVDDDRSDFTSRCQTIMVDRDVLKCAPGTIKGLDALRLAYFLGLLLDGPTPEGRYMPEHRPGPVAIVESILTDQAYVDAVRKVLPELRARYWIHDDAYGALMEEGILRASPWHVDHVHLRFAGEDGAPLELAPRPSRTRAEDAEPSWSAGLRP